LLNANAAYYSPPDFPEEPLTICPKMLSQTNCFENLSENTYPGNMFSGFPTPPSFHNSWSNEITYPRHITTDTYRYAAASEMDRYQATPRGVVSSSDAHTLKNPGNSVKKPKVAGGPHPNRSVLSGTSYAHSPSNRDANSNVTAMLHNDIAAHPETNEFFIHKQA